MNIPKPDWVTTDNYMHFRNLNDLLQYTMVTVGAGLTPEDGDACVVPPGKTCNIGGVVYPPPPPPTPDGQDVIDDDPIPSGHTEFAGYEECTRCNPVAKLMNGGSNIKDTGIAQCGAAAAAQKAATDTPVIADFLMPVPLFLWSWNWVQSSAGKFWWDGSVGGSPADASGSLNHAMVVSGILAIVGSVVGLLARASKLIALAGYAISPVAGHFHDGSSSNGDKAFGGLCGKMPW
jgi:hypothetical protein